jgi:triosephosphate isomerase
MRKPIIAGNWKMHKNLSEAVALACELMDRLPPAEKLTTVIAPPFTALAAVAAAIKGSPLQLGAQNLHEAKNGRGAFTGEISAPMLLDAGCGWVIVGHSERRHLFGETDERINAKVQTALAFGLKPIFCLGEKLDDRERGATFEVIRTQLNEGLKNISPGDIGRAVIAYEPVWAIGTGKTASPREAQEVHAFIRRLLEETFGEETARRLPVIYGGSVNDGNVAALMSQADIDGTLVGGASLDRDIFLRILHYGGQ